MLKVYLSPSNVDSELVQVGSVVEVYTDALYQDNIYDSGDDYKQITTHIVNMRFEPDTVYYVRARFIYNFGLSKYIDGEFTGRLKDNNELKLHPIAPVKVPQPKMGLDFDGGQHPTSWFRVTSTFKAILANPIVSTSWLIEDVRGKPVFYRANSVNDLTTIIIGKVLEKNQMYVVKCRHNLKSNDGTLFGSKVFYTSGSKEFKLIPELTVENEDDIFLTYTRPNYQEQIVFEIYSLGTKVHEGTSNTETIDVSTILTYSDGYYTVRAKAVGNGIESEWEYYSVEIDNDTGNDLLPHALPHNL